MRTNGSFTLLVFAQDRSRVLRMQVPVWMVLAASMALAGVLVASSLGLAWWLELRGQKQDYDRLMTSRLRQRVALREAANTLDRYESQLDDSERVSTRLRLAYGLDLNRQAPSAYGIGGFLDEAPGASDRERSRLRPPTPASSVEERIQALAARSQRIVAGLDELRTWSLDRRDRIRRTPHRTPLNGYVSSNFGFRRDPFTGRKDSHSGMDIVAPHGTPIEAPADGIVTFAGRDPTLGKLVIIDHGYGVVTRYGHNGKLAVNAGQRIERGDSIAWVGNSGRSTGPHLHYEVRVNDQAVDPRRFIVR